MKKNNWFYFSKYVFLSLTAIFLISCPPLYASTIDPPGGGGDIQLAKEDKENKVLSWESHIFMDGVVNMAGGIKRGVTGDIVAQTGFILNTEKAHWWQGGKLEVSLFGLESGFPSHNYVGAVQGVSLLEGFSTVKLYYLNYSQEINKFLNLRIGLMDMNDFFLVTDNAGYLINTSFATIPTLFDDVSLATYPNPGVGILTQYDVNRWGVHLGVYQGDPVRHRSDVFNCGYMAIGETYFKYGKRNDGKVKLGIWHTEQRPDSLFPTTNSGIYSIFENNWIVAERKLGTFIQLAANTPYNSNIIPYYAGLGFKLDAIFKCRPEDILSFGIARGWVNDAKAETVHELGYSIKINRYMNVQPDLQFITHPSGGIFSNAWVGLLSVNLDFYD